MNSPNPVFDNALVVLAETKATGQTIHGIRSRLSSYKNEFNLVAKGASWDDKHWSGQNTRRDYVNQIANELKQLATIGRIQHFKRH